MFLARQAFSATFVGALLVLALQFFVVSAGAAGISHSDFHAAVYSDSLAAEGSSAKAWPMKVLDSFTGLAWRGSSQQVLDSGLADDGFDAEPSNDDLVTTMDWSQYDDDMVLRFNFTSPREKKAFVHAAETLVLDVWRLSKASADVRIAKSRYKDFLRILPKCLRKTTAHSVMIEDLQHAVISTFPMASNELVFTQDDNVHTQAEMFFKDYRDLGAINSWLNLLQSTYPQLVTLEVIGQSFEGRDLQAIHIHGKGSSIVDKKTVVVTSGLHAREWISVTSSLYTIYQLISNYNSGPESSLLDELDFLFVPVMNPDGYAYTWEHDRLWRKNRQDTGVAICKGIDLDHSFNYQWQASTGTPCSESYAGAYPQEGLEAKHFAEYINKTGQNGHKYYGYLDWHSYSQSILYPYAYSCEAEPRDEENLLELAYGLAKAIRWTSGKHFDVLAACEDRDGYSGDVGEGSGGSALDFMYHMHAIWAFQVKLRDTGNYGFLMPKKYIMPVAKEMYNSFRYFGDFILHPE